MSARSALLPGQKGLFCGDGGDIGLGEDITEFTGVVGEFTRGHADRTPPRPPQHTPLSAPRMLTWGTGRNFVFRCDLGRGKAILPTQTGCINNWVPQCPPLPPRSDPDVFVRQPQNLCCA